MPYRISLRVPPTPLCLFFGESLCRMKGQETKWELRRKHRRPDRGPDIMNNKKEGTSMRIENVMHQPVVTCNANDHLDTAAGLMWERDCGALPVVEADERVIAMITDRDICI